MNRDLRPFVARRRHPRGSRQIGLDRASSRTPARRSRRRFASSCVAVDRAREARAPRAAKRLMPTPNWPNRIPDPLCTRLHDKGLAPRGSAPSRALPCLRRPRSRFGSCGAQLCKRVPLAARRGRRGAPRRRLPETSPHPDARRSDDTSQPSRYPATASRTWRLRAWRRRLSPDRRLGLRGASGVAVFASVGGAGLRSVAFAGVRARKHGCRRVDRERVGTRSDNLETQTLRLYSSKLTGNLAACSRPACSTTRSTSQTSRLRSREWDGVASRYIIEGDDHSGTVSATHLSLTYGLNRTPRNRPSRRL